jgi:hypothetical protein
MQPQARHAEEVLDVVFPADDKARKVMQPGKESFHSPTPAVTPQRTAILRGFPALPAMRCDHLDTVAVGQVLVQAVAVVGFVADQPRREGVEEAVPENAVDELALMRRSAFDTNGERKTVIISQSDDFRPFAALGGPEREAPFFAPREGGVDESLLQFQFPKRRII